MLFLHRVPGLAGRLAREIFERRVLPWLVAYLAGSWALIEASQFLVDEYGVSPAVPRTLPVVLAFGALSAVGVAWCHGRTGWQRVTLRECAFHGLVAASFVGVVAAGWLPDGTATAEPATAEPAEAVYPASRVGVLYFKDHTADGSLSGLARDLSDGVVHELTQIEPLDVLPAVESTAGNGAGNGAGGLDALVRKLKVGALVEGSLTRAGDSIRVTAQLVETADGTHLGSWEWTVYDGAAPAGSPASLASGPSAATSTGPSSTAATSAAGRSLARRVADRLRLALGKELRRRELESGASDPEALRLYRAANGIRTREALTDVVDDRAGAIALLELADSLLAEAELRDPDWAAPSILRSRMAETRANLVGPLGQPDRTTLRMAIEHADRAVARDPDSGAALERRGHALFEVAEHSPPDEVQALRRAAESDLRAAYRLDAQRPEALMTLSKILDREGKLNAALEYGRRAVAADGFMELGSDAYMRLVEAALQLQRFDEADALCRQSQLRYPPDQNHPISRLLYLSSLPEPTPDDAAWALAAADTLADLGIVERNEEWRAYGRMMAAPTLVGAGLEDSAEAVMGDARRTLEALDASTIYAASYYEAYARLRLGQRDTALVLLHHYAAGYGGRAPSLLTDWWFEELWGDPELLAIAGSEAVEDRR